MYTFSDFQKEVDHHHVLFENNQLSQDDYYKIFNDLIDKYTQANS